MEKITSLVTMSPSGEDEDGRPRRLSTDQMNEDMDRMFEDAGTQEDFSLSQLSSPAAVSSPWSPGYGDDSQLRGSDDLRIHDSDIKFHRSDTFPHVHHPLKPQGYRQGSRRGSRRTHRTSESQSSDKEEREHKDTKKEEEKAVKVKQEEKPKKGKDGAVIFEIGDQELDDEWLEKSVSRSEPRKDSTADSDVEEQSPLLADDAKPKSIIRGAEHEVPDIDDSGRKKTRVQFDVGDEDQPDLEHRTRKRRSYKNRRHNTAEDPAWRRHLGSEHNLQSFLATTSTPTTEEEAMNLAEHDLDVMTSHRFEDPSAYRRPKVRARSSVASIIHVSASEEKSEIRKAKSDRQLPIMNMKKSYDHTPHEVFVELDELKYTEAGLQWKETARWIKYEEDVESVDNRWGKPHLAFLNFHALFSLRRGLEAGAVLLDLEERDLPSIAGRVVDKMIACDQIPVDQREAVIRVLLLRHKHIRENQSSFRLPSLASKSTLVSSDEKLSRSATAGSLDGSSNLRSSVRKAGLSNLFHVNTFSSFLRNNSAEDTNVVSNGDVSKDKVAFKRSVSHETYTQIDIDGDLGTQRDGVRKNKELMKKIPEGAEATAVLVGAVDFLKHPTIAFVRLAEGVMMDNLVEVPIPVRFMFVLLGPFHGEMDYHEVGRSISTLMSDKGFHEVAYRAHSRGQLLSAINEFLNASIVLPPTDWNNKDLVPVDEIQEKASQMMKKKESIRSKRMADQAVAAAAGDGDGGDRKPPPRDPLIRVGKPFYGLIQDVKIRYPKYLSDLKDGLDGQVVAAAIFIFFAALSAAITFGGMYGDKTHNFIGVGECLLMSSVNGMIFALFAAQPLLIVGATGPLMVFDMSLYSFAKTYELDFLSLRVWIGFWMTVFGLLVAAFEAVAIVKKMTRFTEEIFATLVCIIFIYEAVTKMIGIFKMHPLIAEYPHINENNTEIMSGVMGNDTMGSDTMGNDTMLDTMFNTTLNATLNGTDAEVPHMKEEVTPQPNTALLSFILMMGTFIIAYKLKHFRNSKYLGRTVRRALGDFGVPISIVLMVLADYLIEDTYTDKLTMPAGIQPSNPAIRGWIINPFGVTKTLPVWCMFMAAPASLLLFFLVFLEENICHLILSKPEKNMVKGTGFHWDLVLACSINLISGVFGAPFMGPACVRTISHTAALTVMSSTHAPGESPKIVGVKEQRVSGFIVSLLIGLAVLLAAVLNLVPKAVLLGVFLYMGISATTGIHLLERTVLMLMPVKHHPNVPYVKKVRTWKMHIFTSVQILMLVILWVVKQSPAALCFPFVLMLLIPIRLYLLPYVFTNPELSALDGTEASSAVADPDDEPDFFEETHGLPTHVDHHHQS